MLSVLALQISVETLHLLLDHLKTVLVEEDLFGLLVVLIY